MFVDFKYASQCLSDYDCIVCSFNGSGDETVSIGSTLTWSTTKAPRSDRWRIFSSSYTEAYSTNFQFCKNPCKTKDLTFTVEEQMLIQKWLNRKNNYRFKVLQEGYEEIYWEGSFNIQCKKINGAVIGFDVTFTANAPYGFKDEITYRRKCTSGETFAVYNESSEVGHIYPKVKITCLEGGNLSIYNALEDRTTIVANCKSGEVITLDGENQIITTSYEAHKIYNDFNYLFFRLANTYDSVTNNITVNLASEIEITYSPIAKVGV